MTDQPTWEQIARIIYEHVRPQSHPHFVDRMDVKGVGEAADAILALLSESAPAPDARVVEAGLSDKAILDLLQTQVDWHEIQGTLADSVDFPSDYHDRRIAALEDARSAFVRRIAQPAGVSGD